MTTYPNRTPTDRTFGPRPRPVLDRLLARVRYDHGCWCYQGARTRYGHARINRGPDRKIEHAHRVAYREMVGPIPDGMVLDHLCRTPACVNPLHLEVITRDENFRRGASANQRRHDATVCKRGHVYTEANTRWLDGGRRRSCKDCELVAYRKRRERAPKEIRA